MKKLPNKICIILTYLVCAWIGTFNILHAQYPQYFCYDDENGLPSNEVYSLIQDSRGLIWIGCDAGLYKFDGIRYTTYKCASQKSKSITGLNISSSGRLYCLNFQDQIFYLESDTLKELPHSYTNVPNIATDKTGKLYVNHIAGISRYDENTKSWKDYADFGSADRSDLYTKSVCVNDKNVLHFISGQGIGTITNEKLFISKSPYFSQYTGAFLMEIGADQAWIFSIDKNQILQHKNNSTTLFENQTLSEKLFNRKITNAEYLSDGNLWICTYKGVIKYDPNTGSALLFYPELSISDCLIDREGNYWFSTLQSGLIRIPNMNYLVWNSSQKLTKIASHGQNIYYSTVDGYIGELNTETNSSKIYHTGSNADIQCLYYDTISTGLYFFISGNLQQLKDGKLKVLKTKLPPIKSILFADGNYFWASSFGIYVSSKLDFVNENKISESWCREFTYDPAENKIWASTNDGLLILRKSNADWYATDTLFKNTQIISTKYNSDGSILYALAFDGKIYQIDENYEIKILAELGDNIQAYRLKFADEQIYIPTNKGIWIYDIGYKKWQHLNKLSGIASNNVQDICIQKKQIWIATGGGLQRVIRTENDKKKRALIYLRSLTSNNNILKNFTDIQLQYGQSLQVKLETSIYSSNGNFKYAYCINNSDSIWNYFPANIDQINIPNIPAGDFEIALKAIDHEGNDSENKIYIRGFVKPPFWKTIWFYFLCAIISIVIISLIYWLRIKSLRRKQALQIETLQIKNELRLMQESALKAQMNPHFIFNVLNSIKSFIYENDKKQAIEYLNKFADLVRRILTMSGLPSALLSDEIQSLNLYIQLEAMLLEPPFSYKINVSDDIDLEHILIPSLIIQPYVENAFKHGLRHKQGDKNLLINIQKEGAFLQVIIEDNGIGRVHSAEINKTNNPLHQSFATEANARRMALLNKDSEGKVIVHFIDKENGSGTVVELNINLHA